MGQIQSNTPYSNRPDMARQHLHSIDDIDSQLSPVTQKKRRHGFLRLNCMCNGSTVDVISPRQPPVARSIDAVQSKATDPSSDAENNHSTEIRQRTNSAAHGLLTAVALREQQANVLDQWQENDVHFMQRLFQQANNGQDVLDRNSFVKLFDLTDFPKTAVDTAFRMFDVDGNGGIDFREFCYALSICLLSGESERLKFFFTMFDGGRKGYLTYQEAVALLETSAKTLQQFSHLQGSSYTRNDSVEENSDMTSSDKKERSQPWKYTNAMSLAGAVEANQRWIDDELRRLVYTCDQESQDADARMEEIGVNISDDRDEKQDSPTQTHQSQSSNSTDLTQKTTSRHDQSLKNTSTDELQQSACQSDLEIGSSSGTHSSNEQASSPSREKETQSSVHTNGDVTTNVSTNANLSDRHDTLDDLKLIRVSYQQFERWAADSLQMRKIAMNFAVFPEPENELAKVMHLWNPKPPQPGDVWFVVSADWWNQWARYSGFSRLARRDESHHHRKLTSREHVSLGLSTRPPLIDNSSLVNDSATVNISVNGPPRYIELVEHLMPGADFILLPEAVWSYLHDLYGANIILPRTAVTVQSTVQHQQKSTQSLSHTRSVSSRHWEQSTGTLNQTFMELFQRGDLSTITRHLTGQSHETYKTNKVLVDIYPLLLRMQLLDDHGAAISSSERSLFISKYTSVSDLHCLMRQEYGFDPKDVPLDIATHLFRARSFEPRLKQPAARMRLWDYSPNPQVPPLFFDVDTDMQPDLDDLYKSLEIDSGWKFRKKQKRKRSGHQRTRLWLAPHGTPREPWRRIHPTSITSLLVNSAGEQNYQAPFLTNTISRRLVDRSKLAGSLDDMELRESEQTEKSHKPLRRSVSWAQERSTTISLTNQTNNTPLESPKSSSMLLPEDSTTLETLCISNGCTIALEVASYEQSDSTIQQRMEHICQQANISAEQEHKKLLDQIETWSLLGYFIHGDWYWPLAHIEEQETLLACQNHTQGDQTYNAVPPLLLSPSYLLTRMDNFFRMCLDWPGINSSTTKFVSYQTTLQKALNLVCRESILFQMPPIWTESRTKFPFRMYMEESPIEIIYHTSPGIYITRVTSDPSIQTMELDIHQTNMKLDNRITHTTLDSLVPIVPRHISYVSGTNLNPKSILDIQPAGFNQPSNYMHTHSSTETNKDREPFYGPLYKKHKKSLQFAYSENLDNKPGYRTKRRFTQLLRKPKDINSEDSASAQNAIFIAQYAVNSSVSTQDRSTVSNDFFWRIYKRAYPHILQAYRKLCMIDEEKIDQSSSAQTLPESNFTIQNSVTRAILVCISCIFATEDKMGNLLSHIMHGNDFYDDTEFNNQYLLQECIQLLLFVRAFHYESRAVQYSLYRFIPFVLAVGDRWSITSLRSRPVGMSPNESKNTKSRHLRMNNTVDRALNLFSLKNTRSDTSATTSIPLDPALEPHELVAPKLENTRTRHGLNVQLSPGAYHSVRRVQISLTNSSAAVMQLFPTGLANLGNTCYMNSVLQCVAHTPLIRDILITDYTQIHLTQDNALGCGGEIAQQLARLVKLMWSGKYTWVSPTVFKRIFDKYKPWLAGRDQQDAVDFLAALLDGFHEDLNMVTSRERQVSVRHLISRSGFGDSGQEDDDHAQSIADVVQNDPFHTTYTVNLLAVLAQHVGHRVGQLNPEAQQDPSFWYLPASIDLKTASVSRYPSVVSNADSVNVMHPLKISVQRLLKHAQLAKKAWMIHLARNRSAVVDVFQGLLKSSIECLHCGEDSITFDPFMYLPLPVPIHSKQAVTVLLYTLHGAWGDAQSYNTFQNKWCNTCTQADMFDTLLPHHDVNTDVEGPNQISPFVPDVEAHGRVAIKLSVLLPFDATCADLKREIAQMSNSLNLVNDKTSETQKYTSGWLVPDCLDVFQADQHQFRQAVGDDVPLFGEEGITSKLTGNIVVHEVPRYWWQIAGHPVPPYCDALDSTSSTVHSSNDVNQTPTWHIADRVDALDRDGKWYTATIIQATAYSECMSPLNTDSTSSLYKVRSTQKQEKSTLSSNQDGHYRRARGVTESIITTYRDTNTEIPIEEENEMHLENGQASIRERAESAYATPKSQNRFSIAIEPTSCHNMSYTSSLIDDSARASSRSAYLPSSTADANKPTKQLLGLEKIPTNKSALQNRLRVHFDYFPDKWDEIFMDTSTKLAPIYTKTKRSSRQTQLIPFLNTQHTQKNGFLSRKSTDEHSATDSENKNTSPNPASTNIVNIPKAMTTHLVGIQIIHRAPAVTEVSVSKRVKVPYRVKQSDGSVIDDFKIHVRYVTEKRTVMKPIGSPFTLYFGSFMNMRQFSALVSAHAQRYARRNRVAAAALCEKTVRHLLFLLCNKTDFSKIPQWQSNHQVSSNRELLADSERDGNVFPYAEQWGQSIDKYVGISQAQYPKFSTVMAPTSVSEAIRWTPFALQSLVRSMPTSTQPNNVEHTRSKRKLNSPKEINGKLNKIVAMSIQGACSRTDNARRQHAEHAMYRNYVNPEKFNASIHSKTILNEQSAQMSNLPKTSTRDDSKPNHPLPQIFESVPFSLRLVSHTDVMIGNSGLKLPRADMPAKFGAGQSIAIDWLSEREYDERTLAVTRIRRYPSPLLQGANQLDTLLTAHTRNTSNHKQTNGQNADASDTTNYEQTNGQNAEDTLNTTNHEQTNGQENTSNLTLSFETLLETLLYAPYRQEMNARFNNNNIKLDMEASDRPNIDAKTNRKPVAFPFATFNTSTESLFESFYSPQKMASVLKIHQILQNRYGLNNALQFVDMIPTVELVAPPAFDAWIDHIYRNITPPRTLCGRLQFIRMCCGLSKDITNVCPTNLRVLNFLLPPCTQSYTVCQSWINTIQNETIAHDSRNEFQVSSNDEHTSRNRRDKYLGSYSSVRTKQNTLPDDTTSTKVLQISAMHSTVPKNTSTKEIYTNDAPNLCENMYQQTSISSDETNKQQSQQSHEEVEVVEGQEGQVRGVKLEETENEQKSSKHTMSINSACKTDILMKNDSSYRSWMLHDAWEFCKPDSQQTLSIVHPTVHEVHQICALRNEYAKSMNFHSSNTLKLEQCLDCFSKLEVLPDWICPKCEKKGGRRTISLWSLPDILIITLKRFSYNSYVRGKIDRIVNYPVHGLDLAPWCSMSPLPSAAFNSPDLRRVVKSTLQSPHKLGQAKQTGIQESSSQGNKTYPDMQDIDDKDDTDLNNTKISSNQVQAVETNTSLHASSRPKEETSTQSISPSNSSRAKSMDKSFQNNNILGTKTALHRNCTTSSRQASFSSTLRTVYDLYGVINHIGTLTRGHYTARCAQYTTRGTQEWIEFDDERTKILHDASRRQNSRQAYILFYRRRHLSARNLINFGAR